MYVIGTRCELGGGKSWDRTLASSPAGRNRVGVRSCQTVTVLQLARLHSAFVAQAAAAPAPASRGRCSPPIAGRQVPCRGPHRTTLLDSRSRRALRHSDVMGWSGGQDEFGFGASESAPVLRCGGVLAAVGLVLRGRRRHGLTGIGSRIPPVARSAIRWLS